MYEGALLNTRRGTVPVDKMYGLHLRPRHKGSGAQQGTVQHKSLMLGPLQCSVQPQQLEPMANHKHSPRPQGHALKGPPAVATVIECP